MNIIFVFSGKSVNLGPKKALEGTLEEDVGSFSITVTKLCDILAYSLHLHFKQDNKVNLVNSFIFGFLYREWLETFGVGIR